MPRGLKENRHAFQIVVGALVLVGLSACGGSSDGTNTQVDNSAEFKGVLSGFQGRPDWLEDQADGDAIGEGADGDGGVGIGGVLGQFRNVEVSVYLDDGSLLGTARVDDSGMVTARPGRSYTGGLRIEFRGASGAQYFDEATDSLRPFPASERLRARVDRIRHNIGVTPLTEAAVRHLDANLNGAAVTSQRIRQSQAAVEKAFNAITPRTFEVDNITILPTLLNDSSGANSAPDTPAGRYAVILAATAEAAADFNPGLANPALSYARQLAADLSDGVVDGVDAQGNRAAPASQAAYAPTTVAADLAAGITTSTDKYGQQVVNTVSDEVVQYATYSRTVAVGATNTTQTLFVTRSADGTVRAQVGNGQTSSPMQTVATDAKQLYSGIDNLATNQAMFIRQDDDTILGFGLNSSPAFPFGVSLPTAGEGVMLPELEPMRDIKFGSSHQIGIDQQGRVFTWGNNRDGQLDGDGGSAVPAPGRVPGITLTAHQIGATANVSLAALSDGTLVSWGSDTRGALGQGQLSQTFSSPAPVRTANGLLRDIVSIATCFRTVNALARDGSVWAWGDETLGLLGVTGPARPFAAQIPNLPAMRKIVMAFDGAYGLTRDDEVWYWGLTEQQTQQLPKQVTGLSGVTDLRAAGFGGVRAQLENGDSRTMAYGFTQ